MSTQRADSGAPARRPVGRPRQTEPSEDHLRRLGEIIETGARVFHEHGYDSGTLEDVATALDLRRASLYHYLRNKAQLLYFIFDRALTTSLFRLDEIAQITAPHERLTALVAHQVQMVSGDPSLFAVFFDNRPRLDGIFQERIAGKEREYVCRVTDMIAALSESGELDVVDATYAAHAFIGMTSWTYKWFDPAVDASADTVATMLSLIGATGRRTDSR
jgi:AcrR family transcriptional regulator